jgi:formylglycine-generating enzyme required for sulfatase activity
MTQVFISYSRKDLIFIERLADDLGAAGLEVWYDLSGLDGGTRWGQEIQSAIQKSQIFVVVLSPNSIESQWVEREFMYADSLKKKIIPLLYQPCETPMWFINLHFIDVQGDNYDSHFWIILKAMGVKPGDMKRKIKPGVERPSIQAKPESLIPPVPPVAQEVQKTLPPRRKIKFLPALIIAVVGLMVVIAIAVWGLPALSARLASNPTATRTLAPVPTLTLALAPGLKPKITFTPMAALSTRPVDGMTMLYVPEGNFIMGANSANRGGQLVHNVFLDAYWIDKTDVTNVMYSLCVKAAACQAPGQSSSFTRTSYYGNSQYENYPVIWVNWNDASAYCIWAGARLPTEAQWEKASRGTDGRPYPWGNSNPNKSLLNYNQNIGDTTAVDNYPTGASLYGALDMAGNVWDWVNDWYGSNYFVTSPSANPQGPSGGTFRVLRGGAWNNNAIAFIDSSLRDWQTSGYESNSLGFRCARLSP